MVTSDEMQVGSADAVRAFRRSLIGVDILGKMKVFDVCRRRYASI